MKKTEILLSLCIIASMISCRPQASASNGDGVVINGVRWARCNVNTPGTFADNPEDAGMFYCWNSEKAWPATGELLDTSSYYKLNYTEWEKVNDPSPVGWRLPTIEDFERLYDTEKVTHKWTVRKGVKGQLFTDIATGNSIFLPAAGYRDTNGGESSVHWAEMSGFYWSSTPREHNNEQDGFQFLKFDDRVAGHSAGYGRDMFSVRCVAE